MGGVHVRGASQLDTWAYLGIFPTLDARDRELARFSFDDGGGAVAREETGRFGDAPILGNVAWTTATIEGQTRSSFVFDGATHAQTAVPSGAARTLAAWIQPTTSADVAYFESVIDSDTPGMYGTGFGLDDGFVSVILDDEFCELSSPGRQRARGDRSPLRGVVRGDGALRYGAAVRARGARRHA